MSKRSASALNKKQRAHTQLPFSLVNKQTCVVCGKVDNCATIGGGQFTETGEWLCSTQDDEHKLYLPKTVAWSVIGDIRYLHTTCETDFKFSDSDAILLEEARWIAVYPFTSVDYTIFADEDQEDPDVKPSWRLVSPTQKCSECDECFVTQRGISGTDEEPSAAMKEQRVVFGLDWPQSA